MDACMHVCMYAMCLMYVCNVCMNVCMYVMSMYIHILSIVVMSRDVI